MGLTSGLADFDFAAVQITSNTDWQTVEIPGNWVAIEIANPPGAPGTLHVGRGQTGTFAAANDSFPVAAGSSWRRSRIDIQPVGQPPLRLSLHMPGGNTTYVYFDLSGPSSRGPGGV